MKHLFALALSLSLALGAPRPALATVQDDVVSITRSALQKRFRIPSASIQVNYAAVVGQWGFTSWTAGDGGGDTLMEQINGDWNVVSMGHGQMNLVLVSRWTGDRIAGALLSARCPRPLRVTLHGRKSPTSIAVRRTIHGKHVDSVTRCPQ